MSGLEATLRIKQTAKTPCSHETCNSVGKKKKDVKYHEKERHDSTGVDRKGNQHEQV